MFEGCIQNLKYPEQFSSDGSSSDDDISNKIYDSYDSSY